MTKSKRFDNIRIDLPNPALSAMEQKELDDLLRSKSKLSHDIVDFAECSTRNIDSATTIEELHSAFGEIDTWLSFIRERLRRAYEHADAFIHHPTRDESKP